MKHLFKLAAVAATLSLAAGFVSANEKIGFADTNFLSRNHPTVVEVSKKLEQALQEVEKKFADENAKLVEEEKSLLDERKKIEEDSQKLEKEQGTVESSIKKKAAALEKDAPRLRSKEIQARQDAINNEAKAFQKKVSAIQKREEEFSQKVAAFQKKVGEFQEKLDKAQQAVNREISPADLQEKVNIDINTAIKTLAERKGYTLVLSPAVAFYAKDDKADITEEVLSFIKENVKPAATQAK